MLGFVSNESSKVTPNDAMPSRAILLIEISLHIAKVTNEWLTKKFPIYLGIYLNML